MMSRHRPSCHEGPMETQQLRRVNERNCNHSPYNRAAILGKTLEAYGRQTGDHRICEILVVDDGSTDETRQTVVEKASAACQWIRYLRQPNEGRPQHETMGYARRPAISSFSGTMTLFPVLGSTRTCELGGTRTPQGNCGVLGYVAWWPEVRPTPFMKWAGTLPRPPI